MRKIGMFYWLPVKIKYYCHVFFVFCLVLFLIEKWINVNISPFPSSIDTKVMCISMLLLPLILVPITAQELREEYGKNKK